MCYDPFMVENYINHFFSTVADVVMNKLPSVTPICHVDSKTFKNIYTSKGITGSNIKLQPVDNDYVFKELKQLNESKSTGFDDISPLFLKQEPYGCYLKD